jgi:hypothetical protein
MANGYAATLASNATTGNGSAVSWPGGAGIFFAEATWGGGSAKLQFQSPRGTWIDYPSGSLSADGGINFTLPAGQIRCVVDTATAAYAYAVRNSSN